MIEFRIDRRLGMAPYMQLIQQVRQALRLGHLSVGDRLPTARQVVAATAINPNTVLKAYRELERDGLVKAKQGVGTFVTRSLAGPDSTARTRLHDELTDWLARAARAGLEREDIEALVSATLDAHFPTTDDRTSS